MQDPLTSFSWASLYRSYDLRCLQGGNFDSNAKYLDFFQPRPNCDRALYYSLVEQFAGAAAIGIPLGAYEAMLY